MKFAYFVRPHIGGTYTVFKQLREGLANFGIEICWLAMGHSETRNDPMWFPELAFGTSIDTSDLHTERDQAKALAAALIQGGYNGVFINVLSDLVPTNIARYLPENIMRIMIVHNITPGTYAAAVAIRDHVHATVAVSERCCRDLVEKYKFSKERTCVIPNAINPEIFRANARKPSDETKLRMIFLGRIEDASKGVFWLPGIMGKLPESVSLTVAGNGPDLEKLKRNMVPYENRVAFLGAVPPSHIPDLLLGHDVLIMPSRFEGYPLTLIEAMAAGCVPIVSRIQGVTDTIVTHGFNGFLFPVGGRREAAGIVSRLCVQPGLLASVSAAARSVAEQAFTLDGMAHRYYDVINRVGQEKPCISAQLDLDAWSIPSGFRPGLRAYVPRPIKNWLRIVLERV